MTTKIPVELSSTPGIVDGSNATAITINSSENVGIGTSSPANKLAVNGAISIEAAAAAGISEGLLIDYSTSLARFLTYDSSTGSDIAFYTQPSGGSTTERMRIDSSGNVGIGISPSKKLTVFGTGSGEATVQIEGEGGADPYINFLANNTQHWSLGIDDSDSDKFKLSEHSALGTNDYFTVNTSGNIGIGTASPDVKLHVYGGDSGATSFDAGDLITIENSDSLALNLVSPSTNQTLILFSDNGTRGVGLVGYNHSENSLRFHTSNAERMRITSGGTLCIGTTSSSDTSALDIRQVNNQCIRSESTSSGTITHIQFVKTSGGTAQIGSITGTTSNVAYNTSSDARKKNVISEASGLDTIQKLNPVKFEWKDSGLVESGLIAQEVLEVEDTAYTVQENTDGYYVMDYSKLVTPLVKAIQEQQEQIEQLKTEIQTLKGE